jgi:hypothetical protein
MKKDHFILIIFGAIFLIIILSGAIIYLTLETLGKERVRNSEGIIECGEDIDCFYEASKNCIPSNWISPIKSQISLSGLEDGKCVLVGGPGCKAETDEISAMIKRWSEDFLSTKDWDICE